MISTLPPCILLDFDGVILKNRHIDAYITKKSIEHVSISRKISLDHAMKLNSKLYPKLFSFIICEDSDTIGAKFTIGLLAAIYSNNLIGIV